MIEHKRIKIGKGSVEAFSTRLQSKSLVLLKGAKGYIMCGYLNLSVARKFKDTAAKIVGVATISDALNTRIHSATPAARKLGIKPGQPVKEALRLLF